MYPEFGISNEESGGDPFSARAAVNAAAAVKAILLSIPGEARWAALRRLIAAVTAIEYPTRAGCMAMVEVASAACSACCPDGGAPSWPADCPIGPSSGLPTRVFTRPRMGWAISVSHAATTRETCRGGARGSGRLRRYSGGASLLPGQQG